MPSWIYIFSKNGKGRAGLMGPYTSFRAGKVAEKVEAKHVVLSTVSRDPVRAKREIKRKLIEEHGYEVGSKRVSKAVTFSREDD